MAVLRKREWLQWLILDQFTEIVKFRNMLFLSGQQDI